MPTTIDPAIQHIVVRAADSVRVRSDTASVVERADGTLLVAYHSYSHGPEGGGDFGAAKIYLAESADSGRHWTNERMVADIIPGDLNVMSPFLCQVEDEILLGYVRNHSAGDTSMHLHRSRDGGTSFGDSAPIWEHAGAYRIQGGASSLVRLNSGRLILPIQSCDEVWVADENQSIGTYFSDDGGHTWTPSANNIGLPMRGAMEPSIAQRADGSLLMSMRTQLGAVFFAESDDGGEHWSRAQTSGLRSPESCTCLRRLPDSEDLVLFWNDAEYLYGHHHFGIRSPLSAAISSDGGRSWCKIGDIDAGDCMLTNLSCTFLSSGAAIITYLTTPDPEIENGVYRGTPSTKAERDAQFVMELKAALIPQAWFTCTDAFRAQQSAVKPAEEKSRHPSALPPLTRQAIDAHLNRYCEERVPEHVRGKIRLLFKVRGLSVTLFESRSLWNDPTQWVDGKIAQFRYDLETGTWALYCADRNGRWQRYDPQAPSKDFDDLLQEIERDPTGIFW
ncbi:MAG TPA: DUF3024 domain-containing protein [Candidatus Latescibacteria bacterium]|nr:DUF3024 domain-containing protein [Candidatus Handelsmanbacteria bacterium]HIL11364.1 DUF3024 domain-containing protein [Candidatus Latescibacterota bacterium]